MDNFDVTENDNDVLKAFGGATENSLNKILSNFEDSSEEIQNFAHSAYYDLDSISNVSLPGNRTFNVLSLNIQSIQAKFDAFTGFLQVLSDKDILFDAILIQESWLSDSYLSQRENTSIFDLPGYNMIHQGKICCGHGGLITYVRDIYKSSIRSNLYKRSDVYEALYVDVTNENLHKKITLGNIYRPSKNQNDYRNVATFVLEIEPTIDRLDKEHSTLFFGGDYNANLLEICQKENFQELFDIFVSRGIYPKITLPTRFSFRRATLIDNIYCKLPDGIGNGTSGIFVSKISDHFPIFTCQELFKSNKNSNKYITTQDRSTEALNNFTAYIHETINKTEFSSELTTDPNVNYSKLENILIDGNNRYFPTKQKRFNKYKHKLNPWMTVGIMRSLKFRDKLYRELKSLPYLSDEYANKKTNLLNYSKLVQKTIRRAKFSYHNDLFSKFKFDSKKTWQHINDILCRKKVSKEMPDFFLVNDSPIYDGKQIADKFNDFFVSVGPSFSAKIPEPSGLSYKDYLKKNITSRFNFDLLQTSDILKAIQKLKTKTSYGYDGLSTKILKHISLPISPLLTIITNQSLFTGIFPEKLKIAKVIPLFKKGNDRLFDNYRPISLLPSISKVIEKIVYKQLYNYFVENNLIYDSQYGFRELHSTELAGLEITDRLTQSLDKGDVPMTIYLDLSKAFDTLNHEILLDKLNYYGVKDTANDWFRSYLTNRKQFVSVNNYNSSMKNISTGVPQGSILGPLLFLIAMNDIHEASDKFHAVLYADDTSLIEPLCTFDTTSRLNPLNIDTISTNINSELQAIYDWLCVNKLSLNIPKTKFMLFHHKQRNIDSLIPNLSIDGNVIEYVTNFNFLGLILDENLSFDLHIQKISNKISRSLGTLNKLKRFLPQHTLLLLYNSLILPHLQYAISCWGFKSSRLLKLQKRAMRIITCSKYNAHTDPIFKKLKILQIDDLYNLSLLKFYYKFKKGTLPRYFHNIVYFHEHSYPTRYIEDPAHRLCLTEYAKNSVRNYLPVFLDTMPASIVDKVDTHSLQGFSKYCKHYYISKYEDHCSILNCYVCSRQN